MFTFRRKLNDPNNYSKGQINLCVIFCIEDLSDFGIQVFKKKFVEHYANAVDSIDNIMKLQYYEVETTLPVQFYDADLHILEENLPNFYIRFTKEGYVLSTDKVKNILFSLLTLTE
jgi:hypothetical protein